MLTKSSFRWLAAEFLVVVTGVLSQPHTLRAQQTRVSVRVEVGSTDRNYHDCNGGTFTAAGASVEVGSPFFGEVLGEAAGIQSIEQCLPGRRTASPPFFVPVNTRGPSFRLGVGVGRRFFEEHMMLGGRAGEFLPTKEPFMSGILTLRAGIVTLGVETGQISAKWDYEDGLAVRKWSKFTGVAVGLRFR